MVSSGERVIRFWRQDPIIRIICPSKVKTNVLDYIDWNVFSSRLESDLDESRHQLVSFLRESNYLAKNFHFDLSVYTDFILISNSRTHLSAQDVEALKCMKAPVFVFFESCQSAFPEIAR